MRVEVYEDGDIETKLFVAEFDSVPRVGETVSKDAGGYFQYYDVVDVWYREESAGRFQACLSVRADD